MRIIAGKWRGQKLTAPSDDTTRPILDRAKTVLFDVLGSRLAQPGLLPPIAVLDLFSGTGSLGLEALSRGARFCRFVERNRSAARRLQDNLDHLRLVTEAEIIEGDATRCAILSPPAADDEVPRFELVFVDPPYRMLAGTRPVPALQPLMRSLATDAAIDDDAWIVTRHDARGARPDLAPLVDAEIRDVGHMTLRFLRRPATSGGDA